METQPLQERTAASLGAFTVNELGQISLAEDRVGGFAFRWRGRPMMLEIDGTGASDGQCRLLLSARVGRIPSTALSPRRRPEAFALLRELPALLPAGWTLSLLADHGLRVRAETTLRLPAVIGELLVSATRFVIEMAPYLDVLERYEVGMRS